MGHILMTASLFTCQKSAAASRKAGNLNVVNLNGGSAILSNFYDVVNQNSDLFLFLFSHPAGRRLASSRGRPSDASRGIYHAIFEHQALFEN